MKKRITQIISLALAVLMVLSLAACGKKPTPGGTSGTPGSSTGSTSGSASTPGKPDLEATRGQINPKQELNPDGTKKKLIIGIQQNANVLGYDNNYFTQYMEELMNIDIEIVLFASDNNTRAQQINTMLAGKEALPDILYHCFYSKADQAIMGDDGYFMDMAPYFDDLDNWDLGVEYDLSGYFEQYREAGGSEDIDAALYKFRTPEGKMYAWPSVGSVGGQIGADSIYSQMWINKVWLDNLGLQKPTNWDELLTVLRAFKTQDPNKNGKTDEIAFTGFGTHVYGNVLSWVINMFGAETGYLLNENVWLGVWDDGTVYNPYMQDEYRDGLRRLHQLYSEGLLDPSCFTMTANDVKAYFTPASGKALVGLMSGHITAHSDRVTTNVLMEYEALPMFETATVGLAPKSGSRYYFITDSCRDFDLAAEFLLTFMYGAIERYNPEMAHELYYANSLGKEGEDWHYVTDLKTGKTLPKKDNPNAGGSGQTKSTWAVGGPTSYIKIYNHELDQEDHYFMAGTDEPKSEEWNINKHYSAERRNLSVSYFEIAAKNNPKYTGFNEPQFTIDEEDEVGSAKADIKLYAQQERIKFVTGELDINDDKAWQSYLDGFAPLYNEEYLKCSQAAFDRMYKTAG